MLRRLARSTGGSVLVEFALAMPVLLLLFSGGNTLSDMIACNRKVTLATRALADMISRSVSPAIIYNSPGTTNARSLLSAAAVVLSPYRLNLAKEELSLLRVCDATHAYVVWSQAQTQSANGSTVTSATPSQTAGTLPASGTQSAASVVTIPTSMVTGPMIPTSPDGSNVCQNLAPGTSTKTQVGTVGGYIYRAQITYTYTPTASFISFGTTPMTDTMYMLPRLF